MTLILRNSTLTALQRITDAIVESLGRFIAVHARVEDDWRSYCGWKAPTIPASAGIECFVPVEEILHRIRTGLDLPALAASRVRHVFVATGANSAAVRSAITDQLKQLGFQAMFREDLHNVARRRLSTTVALVLEQAAQVSCITASLRISFATRTLPGGSANSSSRCQWQVG